MQLGLSAIHIEREPDNRASALVADKLGALEGDAG